MAKYIKYGRWQRSRELLCLVLKKEQPEATGAVLRRHPHTQSS